MPVLLLAPPFTENSQVVWESALKAGWRVERLRGWEVPEDLRGREVVYYGFLRPVLAGMLMDALGRALLEPPADWLPHQPRQFLKREVRTSTLGEARGLAGPSFVKPAEDKPFPARIYASGRELPVREELPESLPVLLAEPVAWEVEYRCFALEGEPTAVSPYWRGDRSAQAADGSWPGAPEESREALAFSRQVLSACRETLPPAVVLDVGRITGRGWAVVEVNPAWAAAL